MRGVALLFMQQQQQQQQRLRTTMLSSAERKQCLNGPNGVKTRQHA